MSVRSGLTSVSEEARAILSRLGVTASLREDHGLPSRSPITGEIIAFLDETNPEEAAAQIERAHEAYLRWRAVPPPRRGEFVRVLSQELRAAKDDLGRLVTLETGKSISEGMGEVQEMIDVCDFAVGLSRQLYGYTIPSERPHHRVMETWHPLGVVGVISAFNFPVAVWCWNAALAFVCGDSVVWKPSEKTPLSALAVQELVQRAIRALSDAPQGLSELLIGGKDLGWALVQHPRVKLVSATGSTEMGRAIAPELGRRFARSILELGGNNAAIIAPSVDLSLTIQSVAFSALGTSGQRCTTLRRLFVHESIYASAIDQLEYIYGRLRIGDPRDPATHIGPLISDVAFKRMESALEEARRTGGVVFGGERVAVAGAPSAYYVCPAFIQMRDQVGPMLRETFAPILYVMPYTSLADAIELNNLAAEGLASSIYTVDMREAEQFLASTGSDCGIANVNLGTSGAEIGGSFGGEKDTGGGREAGTDSWKSYMRRATNTINYGSSLPHSQGVRFHVD